MAAILEPPPAIAGYSFDRAPDLTDAKVREQLSGSAIKAFVKIAAKWDLTESQARGLLGGIASSTFHAWKSEPNKQKLSQDTLLRISLVIGIYKALHIYFGEKWADRWVTLGNRASIFAGTAPIEYMIRQGQPGMLQVRRTLDAWRGGR
ncbi:MAG TPA: MbcA/ParS/Xre antitoxin family protein [Bryobacteraceae bacterium]